MLLFLTTIWAKLLRLICAAPNAPMRRSPAPIGEKPHRRRRRDRPEQQRRHVRLCRISNPTLALHLIADAQGEVSGVCRVPDKRDLATAWAQLGDPIKGFVMALIAIGESVPRFLISIDEKEQLDHLEMRARRSVKIFVKAIRCEAPVRVSREAENALARNLERHFRGKSPAATRTAGEAGEVEWHVIDSMGRPLLCRILKQDDGRLEILDPPAGFLHPDTLRLSCWRLEPGWLPLAPQRVVGAKDDGGLPTPQPRPDRIGPKA